MLRPYILCFVVVVHLASHTVFDVIVDDEVQFFVRETIMYCKDAVYFVNDGFGVARIKFIIYYFTPALSG